MTQELSFTIWLLSLVISSVLLGIPMGAYKTGQYVNGEYVNVRGFDMTGGINALGCGVAVSAVVLLTTTYFM